MLPTLLWRCPLCLTHDTLVHNERFLRPDIVRCTACDTRWKLKRVVGGPDYRLRVLNGERAGEERPLSEWYDMVKADLELIPIEDPIVPLETEESLYLQSGPVELSALNDDLLFWPQRSLVEGDNTKDQVMETVGTGRLYLTDRRMIFNLDKQANSIWLRTLRAVLLQTDRYLILRCEQRRLYMFEFLEESLLKWLAHLKMLVKPVEEALGLSIHLPYD